MRQDAVAADLAHVVERGAEPDRLDDRRRAGLEAVRRRVVGHALGRHDVDHLAATVEGRQGGQHIVLAVEHADAGRSVDLVTGEDVEIGVEVAHVDVEMHGALRPVDHDRDPACVGDADHLLDGRDRAEHVRHVRDGDDLGARRQRPLEILEREVALVVDSDPSQDRPLAFAVEVPGDDVGIRFRKRSSSDRGPVSASGPRPRCRDRPTAFRRASTTRPGSRRECGRRRRRVDRA